LIQLERETKVGFMPRKNRSPEEVAEILRAFASGEPLAVILKKFAISESAYYRIIRVSRGRPADNSKRKQESKIARLEKQLQERNKEIALLKSVLKKS
jgi:hypothetical protein